MLSTVNTDALVLKHQAISIHNADKILILLHQFQTKFLHIYWKTLENKSIFKKGANIFKRQFIYV